MSGGFTRTLVERSRDVPVSSSAEVVSRPAGSGASPRIHAHHPASVAVLATVGRNSWEIGATAQSGTDVPMGVGSGVFVGDTVVPKPTATMCQAGGAVPETSGICIDGS